MRPVPSLTSASPSRTVAIRRGAPTRRTRAVADTGSVGPRIAPSTNATGHGRSPRSATTAATPHAVSEHEPDREDADRERGRAGRRRSARNAAEYSSGGRNPYRTTSGSSSGSGTPRKRPIPQPAEHEQHGVGDAGDPRRRRQDDHGGEEQQHGLERRHGSPVSYPDAEARRLRQQPTTRRPPPARGRNAGAPRPRRRTRARTAPRLRWRPSRRRRLPRRRRRRRRGGLR